MLKQKNSGLFFLEIIQRFFRREVPLSPEPVLPVLHMHAMTNVQGEQEREDVTRLEAERLLRSGSTGEEIHTWTLLRDRYQHDGNDRGAVLRRLEFLRFLVQTGKIER